MTQRRDDTVSACLPRSRAKYLILLLTTSAIFADTASAQVSSGSGGSTADSGTAAASPAATADAADTIVVTGTLLRRRNTETPSPVTVLTADDLEQRGLQTVQAAVQSIAANNGPALTNSFTANGAFAGGASAVSLRGLTTNSTLVLFDGLRAPFYPLADDGVRNFVDLNTIPDEIVDRVEVLKDGASASYGADAVAGVVNIITKRQVTGLHLTGEAGISEKGDAANHRFTATYGFGDLADKGYNFYVSGHYLDSAPLYQRNRGYPYNTADQTGLCYNGVCGPNNIANGATNGTFSGLSTSPTVFIVRPATADNSTALDRYQLLNAAAGCRGLTPYTLSDADYAANATAPRTVCQQDLVRDYGQIEPKQQRYGVSARGTVLLGERAEAYAEFNYERSYSSYTGTAGQIRALAPSGILYPGYSTNQATTYGNTILALPVYICPRGTVTCTAANGTLNPNNPFASQGEVARIAGRLPNVVEFNSSESQVYRLALGVKGSFGDDWRYTLDGTAAASALDTTAKGYVFIQHLLDVIADGTYNFVNPELNSAATINYLTPPQYLHDSSHLYQGQATLAKDLFSLPGGKVQAVIGAALRYESLNDPSGNPDYNGPTQRYFVLNAFGAAGHRYVEFGILRSRRAHSDVARDQRVGPVRPLFYRSKQFLAEDRREVHADPAGFAAGHLLARVPYPKLCRTGRAADDRLRHANRDQSAAELHRPAPEQQWRPEYVPDCLQHRPDHGRQSQPEPREVAQLHDRHDPEARAERDADRRLLQHHQDQRYHFGQLSVGD